MKRIRLAILALVLAIGVGACDANITGTTYDDGDGPTVGSGQG